MLDGSSVELLLASDLSMAPQMSVREQDEEVMVFFAAERAFVRSGDLLDEEDYTDEGA